MKEKLTDSKNIEHDDISLRDLWRVLINQKKWSLGIPILFLALAAIGVQIVEPKWEATAVIQLGQVVQSGMGSGLQLIEPAVRAIERIKMKSFEDRVLSALKIPLNERNPIANQFRKTLSLKALGTTDFIQIKIRASSRDQAEAWALVVVEKLKDVHEKLTQPTIDRLHKQRFELGKQRKVLEDELEILSKTARISLQSSGDSKFAANLLLSNLLVQKHAELRDLALRELAIDEQLTLVRTYPTSLIDRVYVPEAPVTPKKFLTIVLGAVLGLILGIIVALARNSWISKRTPN